MRVAVLSALGSWLARVGSADPGDYAGFFVRGLKEKDVLRRAHLRCLRQAFKNNNLMTQVISLTSQETLS